ncbi:MAG: hypothetical protein EA384_15355 [Spirochaetaceae bacterium]|nr:MAG: hypothetical protein EA384_15355 [Spirochaetaceae bacterium]
MASFRTIVGARTSGGAASAGFPRGIELLLKKAKADPEFRGYFVVDPVGAAARLGMQLGETESRILRSMPVTTLETAVDHVRLAQEHLPILRAASTVAAMAVALTFIVATPTLSVTGVEAPERVFEEAAIESRERLAAVQEALESYHRTHGEYPSTLEWITAEHPLEGWLPHSYLFDAWDQPLRYEGQISDGKISGYRLESMGEPPHEDAYRLLCPVNPERHAFVTPNPIAILTPDSGSLIRIAGDIEGALIEATASHQSEGVEILWLLNRLVIERTSKVHEISLTVPNGLHELVVQDESGNSAFVVFEVQATAAE